MRRRRDLRRGRLVRASVALLACAVPVFGWRSLGDRIPTATKQPVTTKHALHWIGPGVGPAHLFGEAARDDVLFVGDSRTGAAIVASRFARSGPGNASILWSGGVGLNDVLVGAETLPCERIVIAVSALSLTPLKNEIMQVLLQERIPPFDTNASTLEVLRWTDEAKARGEADGDWGAVHDASVARLVRAHRLAREESRQWTQAFDRYLRARLDLERVLVLHPAYAGRWHDRWFKSPNARANDKRYARYLGPRHEKRRERGRVQAIERIRELLDGGRRVAIVRLPIDAGLREIEDEMVPPGVLASIAEKSGVPYLDLMAPGRSESEPGGWGTGDGSHLFVRDAVRATALIGEWLREDVGW